MNRQYYVYIMTNIRDTVLYTGITNDLIRRVFEHKNGHGSKFASKYRVTKLIYYENTADAKAAIEREKQIKAGSRKKKVDLIDAMNPDWRDLYGDL